MKQRVGEKKRKQVERAIGYPVQSCWARGGRNPRYWDVLILSESLVREDGGTCGHWFPDTQEFIATDMKWVGK